MKRKSKSSRATRAGRSIRTKAYEHIYGMIVSGELVDGVISELAIAQELGISRTPIREAIGQLLAEGLLEQTPNRGTTVVQLKRQDIVDLYELREVLECYAAGKAARLKPYSSEIEQWQKHVDEILALKEELEKSGKPTLNAEQMRRFMVADHSFHAMLMHLAANARMLKAVTDSRLLIRIFAMGHQAYDSSQLDRLYRQHDQIIRAVCDQNPELATNLITEHIRTSKEERLAAIDAWERDVAMRKNMAAFV